MTGTHAHAHAHARICRQVNRCDSKSSAQPTHTHLLSRPDSHTACVRLHDGPPCTCCRLSEPSAMRPSGCMVLRFWIQFVHISRSSNTCSTIHLSPYFRQCSRSTRAPTNGFDRSVAIWSTVHTESWKRKQEELAYRWDMLDFEREEKLRPEFRGDENISSKNGFVEKYYSEERFGLVK